MSARRYGVVGLVLSLVLILMANAPTKANAQTDDFACNTEVVIQTTQLVTVAACPASATEQNELRTRALEALRATAELECQTAKDEAGNSCPTAVSLGREGRTSVDCSEITIDLGALGVGQTQITSSLTISGRFQCTP